jgi:hypothetical protein
MILSDLIDYEQPVQVINTFKTPNEAAMYFLHDYANGNTQKIVDYFYRNMNKYTERFADSVFEILNNLYIDQVRMSMM